jgi:hypothetical protein
VSNLLTSFTGKTRAQKGATIVIGLLLAFMAVGIVSMTLSMEYVGSSEEVCTRVDGQRSCSNFGSTAATLLQLVGVSSADVIVTSEPLLITTRIATLGAVLVFVFACIATTRRKKGAFETSTTTTSGNYKPKH